jgi:hypothetical protein
MTYWRATSPQPQQTHVNKPACIGFVNAKSLQAHLQEVEVVGEGVRALHGLQYLVHHVSVESKRTTTMGG